MASPAGYLIAGPGVDGGEHRHSRVKPDGPELGARSPVATSGEPTGQSVLQFAILLVDRRYSAYGPGGVPAAHSSMGHHGLGGAHHAHRGPGFSLDVRVRSGRLSPF